MIADLIFDVGLFKVRSDFGDLPGLQVARQQAQIGAGAAVADRHRHRREGEGDEDDGRPLSNLELAPHRVQLLQKLVHGCGVSAPPTGWLSVRKRLVCQ